MQIILSSGYTEKDLCSYKVTINRNVLDMFCILIDCAQLQKYSFSSKHKNIIAYLLKFENSSEEFIPNEEIEADLVSLWSDKGIKNALEHKSEIGLEDSAE
jgi:hypothetical protein